MYNREIGELVDPEEESASDCMAKKSTIAELLSEELSTKNVAKGETVGEQPLSADERRHRVWELHTQGWSNRLIASTFNIDPKTVASDIEQVIKEYASDLGKSLGTQLVGESIKMLNEIERQALFEAHHATSRKEYDKKTQSFVVVEDKGEKARLLTVALNARKERINLLMRAGLISEEPQRHFHSLEGSVTHKVDDSDSTKSSEELKKDIDTLIRRGLIIRTD